MLIKKLHNWENKAILSFWFTNFLLIQKQFENINEKKMFLLVKKLEIETTKPTFIISVLKVVYFGPYLNPQYALADLNKKSFQAQRPPQHERVSHIGQNPLILKS